MDKPQVPTQPTVPAIQIVISYDPLHDAINVNCPQVSHVLLQGMLKYASNLLEEARLKATGTGNASGLIIPAGARLARS